MNKLALPLALSLLGLTLSGCPVYDSNDYACYDDFDCPSGYTCNGDTYACDKMSAAKTCSKPGDCDANETCSRSGTCELASCHFASVGCVRGYECSADSGTWQCQTPGSGAGAGGAGADGTGASGASGTGASGDANAGAGG